MTVTLEGPTLVVAIKSQCDGCRDFVQSTLEELAGVRTIVVSGADDTEHEWTKSLHPILVSPETLAALDVRWLPFYVLVDPASRLVLTEGVVFGPAQVAAEIAAFLER